MGDNQTMLSLPDLPEEIVERQRQEKKDLNGMYGLFEQFLSKI